MKGIFTFVAGAAVGSVATAIFMNRKFNKTVEEEVIKFLKEKELINDYDDDIFDEEYLEEPEEIIIDEQENDISEDQSSNSAISEVKEMIKYNEAKKEEIFKNVFKEHGVGVPEEEEEMPDIKPQKPKIITALQFFEETVDDDGNNIVKAEDPMIYFDVDGVLIYTEDEKPEPIEEVIRSAYLNIDETIKHFGELDGEEDVLYLRCFDKPVTDYKIVREHTTFKESSWYPGDK